MIITRTPLRISLGGGGTDIPSYYTNHGGFLLSAAINKYVYITLNRRFEDDIRVSYSRTEIVDSVANLQHPIVREALRLTNLGPGMEIVSIADLPANTGLGSSSSFTVGLLHALHTWKRESLTPHNLAEEAFKIEVEILKEPIGKQDQYIATFGGITCLEIGTDGEVRVSELPLAAELVQELENNVLLFYTGVKRSTSDILGGQSQALQEGSDQVTRAMHQVKEIGIQVKRALEQGDLRGFGELLDRHWQSKKQLSNQVSGDQFDHWYQVARGSGAIGGKLMGAGGGGFFMFYCEPKDKPRLREAMARQGLRETRFTIDFEGSKVVANF